MKKRFRPLTWLGILAAIFIVLVSVALRSGSGEGWLPRARIEDGSPLGGKAFRLLLEREGLRVQAQSAPLKSMPQAKLWVLLDPATRFSSDEAKRLVDWVRAGNTLIWADTSNGDRSTVSNSVGRSSSLDILRRAVGVQHSYGPYFRSKPGLPLPPLSPLAPGAASLYRSGVSKASASGDTLEVSRAHLPIMASASGPYLARVDIGKGRVFVAPDALGWTNYALAQDDNAILAMNLVRAHVRRGDLAIWDQREHDTEADEKITPSLLYFLWQPPLRYAVLQVLAAGLLLGLFWGRRLGRPVPLQSPPNALRASQWALAMSSLFQKVERPHVAALTSGEHFRRSLARRVGLSPGESDMVLAQRAAQVGEVPYELIDHLLIRARKPSDNATEMLRDVQQMEMLLQKLSPRR